MIPQPHSGPLTKCSRTWVTCTFKGHQVIDGRSLFSGSHPVSKCKLWFSMTSETVWAPKPPLRAAVFKDPCTFRGLTEPSGIWAPRPRVHCWPARPLCSMLAPTLSPHVERPSSAGLRLLTARRGIVTHFASSGGDAGQESDQQELVALAWGSAKPSPALWLRIFSLQPAGRDFPPSFRQLQWEPLTASRPVA